MTNKPKITKVGQPCRKCGNPVVRRKGGNRIKPGQKYYFKFYLYCERCKTTYLLNSEKIYTLEEEKKLVAEKLMRWGTREVSTPIEGTENDMWGGSTKEIWYTAPATGGGHVLRVRMKDWNPQDNDKATRKDWDEIRERMDSIILNAYFNNLLIDLGAITDELGIATHIGYIEAYQAHTATTDIMWKALIKTLEGKWK